MLSEKPRVVLAVPALPREFGHRQRLPISVMGMATILSTSGIKTTVIDGQALNLSPQELAEKSLEFEPTHVGLSLVAQTRTIGIETVKHIKDLSPQTITIAGGKDASMFPQLLLNSDVVDFVVKGEGENVVIQIVRAKSAKEACNVTGVVSRTHHTDEMAPPFKLEGATPIDWNLLFPNFTSYREGEFETKRLCPFECVYCTAALFPHLVTFKPPEIVEKDVRQLVTKQSCFIIDDDALVNHPHTLAVFNMLHQIFPGMKLEFNTRVGSLSAFLNKHNASELKPTKDLIIHTGLESAHPQMQKYNGKIIPLEQVELIMKALAPTRIGLEVNFLIGLPPDTKETISTSFEYALKLQRYAQELGLGLLIHVAKFLPYPGTKAYNDAVEMCIVEPDKLDLSKLNPHGPAVVGTQTLLPHEVDRMYAKFYQEFYTPAYVKFLAEVNSFAHSCVPTHHPTHHTS